MGEPNPSYAAEELSGAEWLRYLRGLSLRDRRAALRRRGSLSSAEAALYLNISRKTLYNLMSAEQGPRREIAGQSKSGFGGRCRFNPSDLDAWEEHRTVRKDAYSK